MARLSLLLLVAQVALGACALISCLAAEKDDIRALPRAAWIPLILLFPVVGSIAWFVAGRPRRPGPPTARRPPLGGFAGRARSPLPPDDDPEFLRSLDAEQARRDRDMFERWEDDLRRREDDLRRRQAGDPPREDTADS